MGCYPIGKKLSKVVTQCYGGENSNPTYNITYSPPPTYQTTTMAKTVTFSNNNSVFIIPNEPVQGSNIPDAYAAQPEPTQLPPQPEVHKPKVNVPVKGRVRHVHAPDPHGPNQSEQAPNHGKVRFHGPNPPSASSSEPMHGSQQPEHVPSHGRVRFVHGQHPPGINQSEPVHPHQADRSEHEPTQPHPGHGYAAYGYGRYVPSPLPRWAATPKRHEYFSGEYRYYPTPVREGIYSIATDANRLTTIFSEENPNACTIS